MISMLTSVVGKPAEVSSYETKVQMLLDYVIMWLYDHTRVQLLALYPRVWHVQRKANKFE